MKVITFAGNRGALGAGFFISACLALAACGEESVEKSGEQISADAPGKVLEREEIEEAVDSVVEKIERGESTMQSLDEKTGNEMQGAADETQQLLEDDINTPATELNQGPLEKTGEKMDEATETIDDNASELMPETQTSETPSSNTDDENLDD